jgi:hypothetical protein
MNNMKAEIISEVFAITIGENLWQLAEIKDYPGHQVLKNGTHAGFLSEDETINDEKINLVGREFTELEKFLVRVASSEGKDAGFRTVKQKLDWKRNQGHTTEAKSVLSDSQAFRDALMAEI